MAKLKQEGLGKIKIALARCNTASLIDTLEGVFGTFDPENLALTSIPEPKESGEEIPTTPSPTTSGPLEVEIGFSNTGYPSCSSRNF